MDGKVVTGLGNIYVNEILHRARVHPLRRACDVPKKLLENIVSGTADVLGEAIAAGGSSINDYVDGDGNAGAYQEQHRVYGRDSHPCAACQTPIESVLVNARSSFYCPRWQPRGGARKQA